MTAKETFLASTAIAHPIDRSIRLIDINDRGELIAIDGLGLPMIGQRLYLDGREIGEVIGVNAGKSLIFKPPAQEKIIEAMEEANKSRAYDDQGFVFYESAGDFCQEKCQ